MKCQLSAGMTNKGIETLSHLLAAKATGKLRVVKLGPPTDNGGDLSDLVVQEGLIARVCPLLHQPQRLEVQCKPLNKELLACTLIPRVPGFMGLLMTM